jgi:hypothetical protein
MSDPETPTEEFTKDLKRLGTSFNKDIRADLLAEFYRVFRAMSPGSFKALVEWAIQNLDSPFPSIARLRKGAVELGLLKPENGKADADKPRLPRDRDARLVYFECPVCGGTFVVFKSKMADYVPQNKEFECVNRCWGCEHTFHAAADAEPGVISDI